MASKLYWTFYGPRLLRIFKTDTSPGRDYVPGVLESIPDKILSTFHAAYSISMFASPILGGFLYKKGYFTQEGFGSLLRIAMSFSFVYIIAFFFRGLGRMSNGDYRQFIAVLIEARKNPAMEYKKMLAGYDFEFWAWPVDFKWDEGSGKEVKSSRKPVTSSKRAQAVERSSVPCRILSYIAMHTFGHRMVYPGATSIMNYLLGSMVTSGRAVLVEEKKGKRAKILTKDSNEIDTMFIDKRGRSEKGNTLVISFEGNAGFYEMGCSGTPIDLNYSVLGWNHPGFAGSTGVPFPEQEQNAIDAVMQYAIVKLGFKPEEIGLFAWSIGGYTACWAAKTYPDIKFVVLDATFDDIVPLAIAKMPESWKSLVALSLRSYMDLNVAEQLLEYQGPVLLIRRTRDEIITTDAPMNAPPVILSNRGNYLLLKLLQYRYPTIVDNTTLSMLKEFLALETVQQVSVLENYEVKHTECDSLFSKHVAEHGRLFPMHLDVKNNVALKAKLALFLVVMHLENFESTHCTPLPGNFLHMPWVPGSNSPQ